jgi:hypothetical protein
MLLIQLMLWFITILVNWTIKYIINNITYKSTQKLISTNIRYNFFDTETLSQLYSNSIAAVAAAGKQESNKLWGGGHLICPVAHFSVLFTRVGFVIN